MEHGCLKKTDVDYHLCFIDGREAGVECSRWWYVVDPSTGEPFDRVPIADADLVESALRSAAKAFHGWRRVPAAERAARLHALAAALRRNEPAFTTLLSRETGKPQRAAQSEVLSAAALTDYFAEESLRLAGYVPLLGAQRQKVLILREPVGLVLAITPFNYPLSTLICKLAPALAVGCTVVTKPDEHTPLCALELARLGHEAGLPPGVFNCVTGTGPETGNLLVNHPLPRMVAFTGSTAVGKRIQAASARWVRKTILELGGHCPAIVCQDAKWQEILPEMISQTFKNSGQYCYRISRIFVAESIYREFLAALAQAASQLRVGPAADALSDLGPLNNADIFNKVKLQVEGAVIAGASVLLGGKPLAVPSGQRGFYYPPTILTEVHEEMAIMQEEVFGPVVMVQPFTDVVSALRLANATRYGLAAYLFTREVGNALEWAEQLESGSIWINQIHQAYPEAPFGGMKESGLGREKSRFGVEEYTELKTIYLSY
jgi:succinate-semialdehyde dehydrogenase/glutarate-semialdehyde dehydrogenase